MLFSAKLHDPKGGRINKSLLYRDGNEFNSKMDSDYSDCFAVVIVARLWLEVVVQAKLQSKKLENSQCHWITSTYGQQLELNGYVYT